MALDWQAIRNEYETTDITLVDIAEKYDIKYPTIKSRKQRQGWEKDASKDASSTKKDASLNIKDASKKKRGPPFGSQNAKGHGAPKGSKNALGNKGGRAAPGNTNAATHHLYSKVIPIEDLDLFHAAGEVESLEYDLQIARYKVNRLIREQQKSEMLGVMGGPDGAESYKLKDDFYEQSIQKGLDIVRKLEAQLQKNRFDQERLELERKKLAIIENKDKAPDKPSVQPYIDALKGVMGDVWDDEAGE